MDRNAQITITIGTLGIMLVLIGLFPGIVGLEVTPGVGVLQVIIILLGFSLLFLAAYIFAWQTFFVGQPTTLAQAIGIRLTLTGLLFSAAAGLADVLGFGSHTPTATERPFLGVWQAVAFIGGFLVASSGIMLYTLMGPSRTDEGEEATNGPDEVGPFTSGGR